VTNVLRSWKNVTFDPRQTTSSDFLAAGSTLNILGLSKWGLLFIQLYLLDNRIDLALKPILALL